MVGMECNGAAFLTSFQEGPRQKLFFQGFFFKIVQVKWQTVIIVVIFNYLMLLLANC